MGLRSVTLGHAHPAVVEAAAAAMRQGTNFTRPGPARGRVRGAPPRPDRAARRWPSSARTARTRRRRPSSSRAPGRAAISSRSAGISRSSRRTTGSSARRPCPPESRRASASRRVDFRYNDLASVDALFRRASGPDRLRRPRARRGRRSLRPGFSRGSGTAAAPKASLLVFDEMITGFRWHLGGAQTLYGVTPDLSTFGKAMANGFAVSALVGRRDVMERGGLAHTGERVFLLSTTHGAETHALAAAMETMKIYEREGVVERSSPAGRAAAGRHRRPRRGGRASRNTSGSWAATATSSTPRGTPRASPPRPSARSSSRKPSSAASSCPRSS